MADGQAVPLRGPGADGAPLPAERAPAAVEFHFTQTDSFPALLKQFVASLVVTTYQANKLLVGRAAGGGLSMLVRTFERPMGLAVDAQRLTIGTRNQIWFLRNAPDIAARVEPVGYHVPATSPGTSGCMNWAGQARNCGSSIPAFRACPRCTPITASSPAGGPRSSLAWLPRTAAI